MAEFNIRTDAVDVEQIMRQIRARIKENRGVDYTEQQIQELANVKLERFLDAKGVRSDLVEQFKRTRGTSPEPPNYGFEDTTIYESHRGIIRFFRRLLNPFLKLLFNPNPIIHVLHMQGQINNINAQQFRVREELDALYYEVIHNLVLELTRLGIENKNLKMRLESISSRLDFDERRARALEGVVQYKPGTGAARDERERDQLPPAAEPRKASAPPVNQDEAQRQAAGETVVQGDKAAGEGQSRRRRRRRRGRRGGRGRVAAEMSGTPPHGDPLRSESLPETGAPEDSGEPHDPGRPEEPGVQSASDYDEPSVDPSAERQPIDRAGDPEQ
jgi:hypothetical protein